MSNQKIEFEAAKKIIDELCKDGKKFHGRSFNKKYRSMAKNKDIRADDLRDFLIKLVSIGYLFYGGGEFGLASPSSFEDIINSASMFCRDENFIADLIDSINGDS